MRSLAICTKGPDGTRSLAGHRGDRSLPNERQEAIFHLCLILRVARKVLSQESFKCEESPPRAECERYADQHDECPGIHRMPHESIRTRRNDGLAFGNL